MKQIEIVYDNLKFSEFDRLSLTKIVSNALGRYLGAIKSVEVRLRDINGPKGGIDKLVTLRILQNADKELIIKSKGSSFVQATYLACSRGKSTVRKHMDRIKNLKRTKRDKFIEQRY